MGDVMGKVKEGARLSASDMNRINELYQLVEEKGSKDDIMKKVDKQDLTKAYRNLLRRIEFLQRELKKAEDARIAAQREEPVVIRKRLTNTECLACGQVI